MILGGALIAAAFAACGGGYGSGGGGGGGGGCGGAYMVACPNPTVSITAPAAGANVSGTVAITADATASAAYSLTISKVEFFVDGTSIGVTMTSPYTVNWDSTKATNGSHSLTATATDSKNDSATSTAVMVTVSGGISAMSAAQIFPAPSSKASGVARISVDSATGAVSGTVTLSGMSARTVTINQGFAGSTGDALVTLAPHDSSGSEFDVPANVVLSAEQAGAFRQGRLYVVATSAANPNGEIRGQLAPESVQVSFSELSASPEAQALGMRASGLAAATVDTHAGTLTVHVDSAGIEDATAARVLSAAGAPLAELARSPTEMGHFSTELARISAADLESFQAGKLSVSVAGAATPAGAIRGSLNSD